MLSSNVPEKSIYSCYDDEFLASFRYFFNPAPCDSLSTCIIHKVHQSAKQFIIPRAKSIQSANHCKRRINLLNICGQFKESVSQSETCSSSVQQLHKILQEPFLQVLFLVYDGIVGYTKTNEFPAVLQNLLDKTGESSGNDQLKITNLEFIYPIFIKSMTNFPPPLESYSEEKDILKFEKGTVLEISKEIENKWVDVKILQLPANDPLAQCTESKQSGRIPLELLSFLSCSVVQEVKPQIEDVVFEKVVPIGPCEQIIRCILFIGPRGVGKNELKKTLISSSSRYCSVVPCTSRLPRKHEVCGVDYNFMERNQMEDSIREDRFIEYGEYHGNLYGTTYDSVLQVMEKGKVPVLEVHPAQIYKLRTPIFKPIVILVRPPEISLLKQTRTECDSEFLRGAEYFSDQDFKQMIATCSQIQHNYNQFIDGVVVNGVFHIAFQDLCQVLQEIETHCYMPENWVDWI